MQKLIFKQSEKFASELYKIIDLPLHDSSDRIVTSGISCSIAFEHWDAIRRILAAGMLPSAVVVHRAQFEVLVRSVWLLYVATENHIEKLSNALTIEAEQSAKNMPLVAKMMAGIKNEAPAQAFDALNRFKENSWKALNSYVHAGIHPIRRHADGYPVKLIEDVTRNANGLAIVSAMQAVVLSGNQTKQKEILELAALYPNCMPPPL